jgi:hypothetical protein
VSDGEWCNQDYLLWVTADLEWILATYGNNEAGVGPRSQTALVLLVAVLQDAAGDGSSALREFTMRLLTCETNEWGYTWSASTSSGRFEVWRAGRLLPDLAIPATR